MSESKFFYSYTDFVKERINFKKIDRVGINRYDSPAALYYKLVFYFTKDSGLLGLNDVYIDDSIDDIKESLFVSTLEKPFDYNTPKDEIRDTDNTMNVRYKNVTTILKNTAYNYLLLNAEYERAHMLKSFITLLSEINSSSPWYFQEITGLDTALERKMFSDGEFKIEDKPRQITIKCLHDAYDNRIGTLLDLYRSACFSYTEKKEVVPANLRKFNMGVLVFNAPIRGKGGKSGIKENRILIPDENTDSNYYIPSAKLIELRNCEIDYNSSKSAWGTLNTSTDPFSPEYTITINFDDCYESRYNEIMGSVVTDFINADTNLFPNVKTIDDNNALGNDKDKTDTLGKKEVEKDYWINSNYETAAEKLYSKKLDYNSNTSNINIDLNVGTSMAANVLTSQWNNLKDKAKEFIQLPSISKDDNIHDYGTVNMFGEFEYLNRLGGMGGFVGNVMQQAVGTATSALKDKVSQVYLGNIHSLSVSNMLDMGKKFLSGDISGGISSAKKYNNPQISDKSMIGSKLPEYNGKDNQQQRKLGFVPTTKEIHDGGELGRALNKGEVLDVDVLNHTIGTENEIKETHLTTSNIQENTSKTPAPRKMPKRMNGPNGNPIDDRFVTSEIWPDPISRNLNKGTILDEDVINDTLGKGDKLSSNSWEGEITERQFTTKEIWPDPIQRDLYKGELIDEDVVNSTLGSGNRIDGKMAWTGETTEVYLRNKELYKDPSQRNIEGIPSQVEIWKDPFQRNIDSDMVSELPGYIKNRTKFLNEMNTKQSIRNNI